MNIYKITKNRVSKLGMEFVFVWILVAVRIFGIAVFEKCAAIFLPSEYGDVLLMLWAYNLYAPFEGALSVICIWLCIRKMRRFSFQTDKQIVRKFLFILLPLTMVSVYSLHWAFNSYPSFVRVQYMYFHNTERKLQKAMYFKFIEPVLKSQGDIEKNQDQAQTEDQSGSETKDQSGRDQSETSQDQSGSAPKIENKD